LDIRGASMDSYFLHQGLHQAGPTSENLEGTTQGESRLLTGFPGPFGNPFGGLIGMCRKGSSPLPLPLPSPRGSWMTRPSRAIFRIGWSSSRATCCCPGWIGSQAGRESVRTSPHRQRPSPLAASRPWSLRRLGAGHQPTLNARARGVALGTRRDTGPWTSLAPLARVPLFP